MKLNLAHDLPRQLRLSCTLMDWVKPVVQLPVLPTDLNALGQLGMGQDFRPVLFDLIHVRKVLLGEAIAELLLA